MTRPSPPESTPSAAGKAAGPHASALGSDPAAAAGLVRSEAQRRFLADLARAASSAATVLLAGESGVGKGRAAAALHAWSPRAGGPIVTTSLAALTPTLVEAELFGHEEGAFTGARRARLGRFRQAHGGTLVLDDVAALPREFQAKLLRAIQERVVEPLGAETPVPIDVRLVATTSRDLEDLVAEGAFREDLYYRLAVVRLRVPALRERREDIPELIEELLIELARRHGLKKRELRPEALERLVAHAWPGNVRELENALERVCVLSCDGEGGGEARGAADPIAAEEFAFLDQAAAGVADELARRALAHGLTLADVERTMLKLALAESQQNISAAARQVGLTRRAFEYRLARERSDAEPS